MTDSVEDGELDESISRLADSFENAATEFAEFVSYSLPDFVNGIANVLNFVITFRDEIGSLVKGVIAFKGAMAISDIILAAVRSFITLKTAMKSAAGAQEVLNNTMAANPFGLVAVAIGMVIAAASELEAHLDDCNQKAADTMETVGDLIDTSQRYRDTAKDLGEVITRFEEAVRNVTAMIEQLKTDSESKERYTQMIANLQNGQDADYEAPEYLMGSQYTANEEERKGKEAAARYEKWKAEGQGCIGC